MKNLIGIYYCSLNDQLVLRKPNYKIVKFGSGISAGWNYLNVRKTMTFIGFL